MGPRFELDGLVGESLSGWAPLVHVRTAATAHCPPSLCLDRNRHVFSAVGPTSCLDHPVNQEGWRCLSPLFSPQVKGLREEMTPGLT